MDKNYNNIKEFENKKSTSKQNRHSLRNNCSFDSNTNVYYVLLHLTRWNIMWFLLLFVAFCWIFGLKLNEKALLASLDRYSYENSFNWNKFVSKNHTLTTKIEIFDSKKSYACIEIVNILTTNNDANDEHQTHKHYGYSIYM